MGRSTVEFNALILLQKTKQGQGICHRYLKFEKWLKNPSLLRKFNLLIWIYGTVVIKYFLKKQDWDETALAEETNFTHIFPTASSNPSAKITLKEISSIVSASKVPKYLTNLLFGTVCILSA